MKVIKKIYKKKSTIPEDKLDEILKHDLWWKSKKCLKYGLVDKVIKGSWSCLMKTLKIRFNLSFHIFCFSFNFLFLSIH